MSSEFDEIIKAEFGEEPTVFDQDAVPAPPHDFEFAWDSLDTEEEVDLFSTGVLPPGISDHMALHLLEGVTQFTAALYAAEFVCPLVEAGGGDGFTHVMQMGLVPYLTMRWGYAEVDTDVLALEIKAWVRVTTAQVAIALEAFLNAHRLRKVTIPVHLTNHGWYPMQLCSDFAEEDQ